MLGFTRSLARDIGPLAFIVNAVGSSIPENRHDAGAHGRGAHPAPQRPQLSGGSGRMADSVGFAQRQSVRQAPRLSLWTQAPLLAVDAGATARDPLIREIGAVQETQSL
jgi:hypothetical protein